jgi:hypothetical protein
MKFLKAFKDDADYLDFKSSETAWVTPNVYYIRNSKNVKLNPKRYVNFTTADGNFVAADADFYSIAGPEFYEN